MSCHENQSTIIKNVPGTPLRTYHGVPHYLAAASSFINHTN